jgi:cytochrome c oxidase subunit 1/cytochrome c oxidase subunit I+III
LNRGRPAGNNPWDAPTLEWSTPSPPPAYNFAVIPIVASRHPLWEDRLKDVEGRSRLDEGYTLLHGRETIGTTMLDAEPNIILTMPKDSFAPFFLALGAMAIFTGLLLHVWALTGVGVLVTAGAIIAWLWPAEEAVS